MRVALFLLLVSCVCWRAQAQIIQPRSVSPAELKTLLDHEPGPVLVQFTSSDKACAPCVDGNNSIPGLVGRGHWTHPFLRVSWSPYTKVPAGIPAANRIVGLPLLVIFVAGNDVKEYVGYKASSDDAIARMLRRFNQGTITSEKPAAGPPAASLRLTPQKISLLYGQTFALSIEARDSQSNLMNPLPRIKWSSSADGVAVVDDSGRVHTIRRGRATITGKSGTASANVDVEVAGFADLSATTSGDICAITNSRQNTYCWDNTAGRKMHDNTPPGAKITAVVKTSWSACTLTETGRVYCGDETRNQLGEIPANVKVTGLAAGADAICATASNSTFYCWGPSVAMPTRPQSLLAPTQMPSGEIPPGETLTSIGVNANGGCLLANGDPYCWSSGGLARLVGPGELPLHVELTSLSVTDETTCAAGDDGRVYCFPNTVVNPAWKLIPQGEIPAEAKVTQISVGGAAGSVCAITNGFKAYCWHQPGAPLPRRIPLDVPLLKVVCGARQCSALGDDGRIYRLDNTPALINAPIL
jgi:hypothetical protein